MFSAVRCACGYADFLILESALSIRTATCTGGGGGGGGSRERVERQVSRGPEETERRRRRTWVVKQHGLTLLPGSSALPVTTRPPILGCTVVARSTTPSSTHSQSGFMICTGRIGPKYQQGTASTPADGYVWAHSWTLQQINGCSECHCEGEHSSGCPSIRCACSSGGVHNSSDGNILRDMASFVTLKELPLGCLAILSDLTINTKYHDSPMGSSFKRTIDFPFMYVDASNTRALSSHQRARHYWPEGGSLFTDASRCDGISNHSARQQQGAQGSLLIG